jgi:3-hydroxyacyl-CoA dehydrogenase
VDVEKRSAAIVGAGLIGRAWAVVFARAGWQVRLFDAAAGQLATARQLVAQSLADQEEAARRVQLSAQP